MKSTISVWSLFWHLERYCQHLICAYLILSVFTELARGHHRAGNGRQVWETFHRER